MSVTAGLAGQSAAPSHLDNPRWSDRFAAWADRWRWLCFAALCIPYLAAFNGQWLAGPDSALYLSIGRNIASGRGYTYLGQPHQLVYPGLPYALALLFRIFGSHAIAAADAMLLLCALATFALTYRLVHLAFDRPTAVIVTIGFALTHEYFRYCYEILTDVPFLMGVMALLAGHEAIFHRKSASGKAAVWDWLLLLAGLVVSVTMRPTMIGLLAVWILSLLCLALRKKGPRRWGILAAVAIAALVVLLFVRLDPRGAFGRSAPRSYEQSALFSLTSNFSYRLHHQIADNVKNLFAMDVTRSGFGILLGAWWIDAVFALAFLAAGLALIRIRPLWGLWVAATVAMLVLLVSHDRYMVEILPLLVLGWWRFLRWLNYALPRAAGNFIFAALMLLGTVPNTGEVGGMMIHQQYRPFLAYYKDGKLRPYAKLADFLRDKIPQSNLILCPKLQSQILAFWSDRRVIAANRDFRALPFENLYIVLDSTDEDFSAELAAQKITPEGPPIVSISRDPDPPLQLLRGRQP
jgi:hypothetical protein